MTLQTFILYPDLEGKPLDVGKALSTLALFNILTLPMALFTLFCTTFITASVSIKRLMRFLLSEETEGLADKNKTLTHSIGIDTTDPDGVTGTEVGTSLVHTDKYISWKTSLAKKAMFISYKRIYFQNILFIEIHMNTSI